MRYLLLLSALTAMALTVIGCGRTPEYSQQQLLAAKIVAADTSPDFYQQGKGTAAEFATNRFYMLRRARWSVRDGKDRGVSLPEAITQLAEFYQNYQQGISWAETRRSMVIPQLGAAPDFSAEVLPETWQNASVFEGEYPIGQNRTDIQFNDSRWYLGWYDNHLYVGAIFSDSSLKFFSQASFDGRKPIFEGDALEIFIQPDVRQNYYEEYLVNARDDRWQLKHKASPYGGWDVLQSVADPDMETHGEITPQGYRIIAKIPVPPEFRKFGALMLVRVNRDSKDRVNISTVTPLLYNSHNIYGYIQIKSAELP